MKKRLEFLMYTSAVIWLLLETHERRLSDVK